MQKKSTGEPIEYARGFTEFLGCKIDLSKKPLIPRKDTEHWVIFAAKDIKGRAGSSLKPVRVLDMFAGSGCIGVALMANLPNVLCDMADSQKNCLEQARINCRINNIDEKRYRIIKSDVFSNIKKLALSRGEGYDYILANPPYVAEKLKHKIQPSVLKYEPKTALMAGPDGMKYIEKFLKQAKEHLNPGGKIYMEFSPDQKNKIEKLLKSFARQNARSAFAGWEFYKDQFDRWRWVIIFDMI